MVRRNYSEAKQQVVKHLLDVLVLCTLLRQARFHPVYSYCLITLSFSRNLSIVERGPNQEILNSEQETQLTSDIRPQSPTMRP